MNKVPQIGRQFRQQQNKWYPQRCLLVHFEATLYFSRLLLWASESSVASKWQANIFKGTIYFAGDGTLKK